jgi:hypothetical protein
MTIHREEGRFTIVVDLSAEFGSDYEGDEDGYAWLERWRTVVQPRLVRAVFEALRGERSFDAMAVSRGANPEEQLEIAVRLKVPPAGAS